MTYTEKELNELCSCVRGRMGEKRFAHTERVVDEAKKLGRLYLPDQLDLIEAAALLHDVTKELSNEEQIALCNAFGIDTSDSLDSPQILHAWTAAAIIPRDFPSFDSPEVILAVDRHTTAVADMTILDEIIYLADYIEPGKLHADCVRTRALFWEVPRETLRSVEHLHQTVKTVLENTIRFLTEHGYPIQKQTLSAYEWFCHITGESAQ